jgi:hypothetical protein
MTQEKFVVKMRIGEDCKFLDIRYGDEYFYLTFTKDDEWQTITSKSGKVYDVHLSHQELYDVQVYLVSITEQENM